MPKRDLQSKLRKKAEMPTQSSEQDKPLDNENLIKQLEAERDFLQEDRKNPAVREQIKRVTSELQGLYDKRRAQAGYPLDKKKSLQEVLLASGREDEAKFARNADEPEEEEGSISKLVRKMKPKKKGEEEWPRAMESVQIIGTN